MSSMEGIGKAMALQKHKFVAVEHTLPVGVNGILGINFNKRNVQNSSRLRQNIRVIITNIVRDIKPCVIFMNESVAEHRKIADTPSSSSSTSSSPFVLASSSESLPCR